MRDESQLPLEFGALRAARGEGAFSYGNATIAEWDGSVAGMALGYLQPDPYDTGDLDDYSEIIRTLVALEAMAPGSWYINALATYEEFRGRGIATVLLAVCEEFAAEAGADTMSLIVADENAGAKRLYEKTGYTAVASRPVVPYPGCTYGGDWLLMTRRLSA
jgi:ribosomal protein S18 acetylase RimI-like enzyme